VIRPIPIHTLPEDYREVRHIVATQPKILLRLNLASLIPLGIALWAMNTWSAQIQRLRGPYNTAFSESFSVVLALALVLLITFGGHELVHALAIRWAGHKARIGMKLDKGVFFATADNALFPRAHFLIIALAPLAVLSLLGMLAMIFVPDRFAYFVGLIVVLNAAGSIGDLWMSAEVLRYPAESLVRDEADSIRIYLRD
jgi:hypothetical protein